MPAPTLLIHGGAGTLPPGEMSPPREVAFRAGLAAALEAGRAALRNGGALDAVVAAVVALEEDTNFNAGRGATLTRSGRVELDASVMEGATGRAGAVAGAARIRNPVRAARLVMERSPHLLFIGPAADAFAGAEGLELMDNAWFVTPHRQAQLRLALAGDTVALDHDLPAEVGMGTVGAVALDAAGHLAAATSTGGMTNKLDGRVGDTPIIGAGTWAEDATCAVSCTGKGEAFIRCAAAHQAASLMRYRNFTPQQAAEAIALVAVPAAEGSGGLIVLDAQGRIGMAFGTGGMYRGSVVGDGPIETAIY
jgi:beta-aspartyl-peptidase (threonine type)